MILDISQGFTKRQDETFKVSKEFKTRTKVTKRTIAVGQAFGIGIDEERKFSVFKDFSVEINKGQVVLITGDSGSGKSTLLKELTRQMASERGEKEFGKIVTNERVEIDPEELIIHGVGKDVSEAISILSMSGLNEAFLMLRRFRELSDGQKYRYRIAKMINSNADTWIFDEFAALLDRVTAKCVAHTIQKTARNLGKTLIVATTHEDLFQDLKPDTWIEKRFGESVRATSYEKWEFRSKCSLLEKIWIEECSLSDIKHLEQFHYRGGISSLVKKTFCAKLNGETIAAIVYSSPHLQLKGRNIAMPEYRGKSDRAHADLVNRDILRISRVIVDPKFRSIGLGAEIVRQTMPLVNVKVVESLAVMSRYNFFFEKAGMKRVDVPEDEKEEHDVEQLESLGFKRELLPSRRHVEQILAGLPENQLEICKRFALKYCAVKKRRKEGLIPKIVNSDRDAITEALKLYSGRPVYLYWINENLEGERRA